MYDGKLYQQEVASGFLANRNNISLIFNTDGVPVFRSSSFSFWPLYLLINELPYKMRYMSCYHAVFSATVCIIYTHVVLLVCRIFTTSSLIIIGNITTQLDMKTLQLSCYVLVSVI